MQADTDIEAVLNFWFGRAREDDDVIGNRMSFWFASNPDVDEAIGGQFSGTVSKAASGEFDSWRQSPQGALALIILLDQFPRNLSRGTPAAFAHDGEALQLCLDGIASAQVQELSYIEQVFFMMPLQHAESRGVQQRSVEQFEALLARIPEVRRDPFKGFVKYAHMHNDIVQRFGRFPHRNALLARADTQEERDYLAGNAPSFGQKK